MTEMDELDYADMVEHSPVDSYIIEYREPTTDGSQGRLVGACLTDKQGDGLSMIYSFFEPDSDVRSGMGNYIILDHIFRSRKSGMKYVYLGYWVEGSERMQYKVRYQPLERLGAGGWVRFDGLTTARKEAAGDAVPRVSSKPATIQPRELAELFRK
jgi:arginine-tRNA-protein transferase